MNTKLSIVVPVHNVGAEKFGRCLDSLVKVLKLFKQSEVLIVNDASPKWNEESKVIPKLAGINTIARVKSEGIGEARNAGLRYVSGEWVWFVDASDSVNPGSILRLMSHANQNPDASFIQFGGLRVFSETAVETMYFKQNEDSEAHSIETINKVTAIPPYSWSRIYRRKWLIENFVEFPEDTLFPDHEHLATSMLRCGKVKITKLVPYRYYGEFNPKWNMRQVFDMYKAMKTCIYRLRKISYASKKYRLEEYNVHLTKVNEARKRLPIFSRIILFFKILIWNINNPK